jgi:hypothetical protein
LRFGRESVEGMTVLKKVDIPMDASIILESLHDENNNKTLLYKFKCIAPKTEPKPTFSWFIEEVLLTEENYDIKDEDEFVQLLSFTPKPEYANQTLWCKVAVEGHSDNLEESVTLIPLALTDEDYDEFTKENSAPAETIIVVVLAAVVVIGLILFAGNKCIQFRKTGTNQPNDDPEAQKEIETEEATDKTDNKTDESTEKTDETKEERESINEITKSASFGERFAAFFRFNRSFVDDTCEENKENGDIKTPEVVVEDSNKVTDDDEEPIVEVAKPEDKKTQNRLMNFFSKMLKPRDVVADKKAEEQPVKMTECKDGDELEPEEKPEPVEDKLEKSDMIEEKKPTPNTSF